MMGPQTKTLGARMPAMLSALSTQALHVLFPPRCLSCGDGVESDFGLCPDCWREAGFISGTACDCCGAPLPGEDDGRAVCDDCIATPRPWIQGRAAMRYTGTGRKLVLAFKHGDRIDLAAPLGAWLTRAARSLIGPGTIIAPVPLHRMRLLQRRYNQSALLARQVARKTGALCVPDLFERTRQTQSQEGKTREERHENLTGAIRVNPKRADFVQGRAVLIVDDVMTSGATFRATTEAALAAGALRVDVAALARVAKDA